MKRAAWLMLTILALLMMSQGARAGVIYAASGGDAAGFLYTLNGATGAPTLVGNLVDNAQNQYSLTGLAFNPITGLLYGSTANASPTGSSHLVAVNPATGLITDIGGFGQSSTMADITFASNGTLYGWHAAGDHSLYTINLATGAATLVGSSGVGGGFGGGGLAANASNVLFATPDSTTNPPGSFRNVNSTTGLATTIATLSGAPLVDSGSMVINAMAFDEAGKLLGINTARNFGATHLVTINTSTGAITDIGVSADSLDAIAVQFSATVPEPSTVVLLGLGLGALVVRYRRRSIA